MSEVSRYLAEIGARGGRKSRRVLDPAAARTMVKVREARRAFRRFRGMCFWSYRPDLVIGADDVPWAAEQLMKHGNREAWVAGAKLCPNALITQPPKDPVDFPHTGEGIMSDERPIAGPQHDEFERVKAIVTSYRLVDTPAIVAAREYGYDIGLLKHSVAEASRYHLPPAQPAFAGPGSTYVREARDVPGDRRLAPEAVTILRQLASHGVRFVVIGGVAAQLHGSARLTKDLDILYDTAPDNIERLAGLLIRWRSYLRGVEPGPPFTPDARTIRPIEVLTLETEHGKFDALQRVAGIGAYADALPAMQPFPVADFAVNALSLESLIKSKLAAGRPRDKTEVLELEALRSIAEQQQAALDGGG
ncbi:MAG: hypothetical protein ACR2L6_06945 [Gemmatimonadaceae bacterium]